MYKAEQYPLQVSLIIPLLNEVESIPELAKWIEEVMIKSGLSYEVFFIDDGSKDNSWGVIKNLSQQNACIKGLSFRRNYGKSAALNEGFKIASGRVVITMDADLQDSPEEIPDLYKMCTEGGMDLVSGWKSKRYDPLSKTIPTKLFNWATRKMSGISLHDFNCGLKAYRNEVVKSIEVYGEMHRYIPIIAKKAGFDKIGEKAVAHQARKFGVTKFGLERFTNGLLDLFSIAFVTRFGKRPMHFFGTLGLLSFIIGIIMVVTLIVQKITGSSHGLTNKPAFYIALTAIILGSQLFLAGFLGELIARSSADRNHYQIKEELGFSRG